MPLSYQCQLSHEADMREHSGELRVCLGSSSGDRGCGRRTRDALLSKLRLSCCVTPRHVARSVTLNVARTTLSAQRSALSVQHSIIRSQLLLRRVQAKE
jgi:hypothetical protein